MLFSLILDRYKGLCEHFNGPATFDSKIVEDSKIATTEVSILRNSLKMESIRRYKKQMKKYIHLGGFIGEIVFENVPGLLVPWIKAGELLQIGKATTTGYGEYKAQFYY